MKTKTLLLSMVVMLLMTLAFGVFIGDIGPPGETPELVADTATPLLEPCVILAMNSGFTALAPITNTYQEMSRTRHGPGAASILYGFTGSPQTGSPREVLDTLKLPIQFS